MSATPNQPSAPPAPSRTESPPEAGRAWHRALVATAWIAGGFCAVLCAVMLYGHLAATTNDPWKSPQLIALKAKLVAEPGNESLKQEIRKLDLEFRQHYRRRLALDGLGGWLLLGGALVLVLAARQAADLEKKLPLPRPKSEPAAQAMRLSARARGSVAVAGGVVALSLLTLALTARTALPTKQAGWDKLLGKGGPAEGATAPDLPTPAELQANWPRFRGWDGSAVSSLTNTPLSWDAKSGAGIAWKTALAAPGHSSPIVWSNRVFVSGGTAAQREVFCFDAASGQLRWQRAIENVPGSPAKQPEVPADTTFAAPTLATDGRRVYALFANGDLAALTLDGAPAWSKNLGVPKNPYGYATSPALAPGRLLVQFDQESGGPGGSRLICLDAATGRALWERGRQSGPTWATPIVLEAAGKTQIITLGLPLVTSYALADGNELWRAELLEGELTPSPIFAGGLVLVVNPSAKLIALRPDGAGDVTKSHVAWTAEDNVPDITSPVSNGELVFTVSSGGMLTCFDAKDGKKVWEKDLEMEVQSSPSLVGGRLLVLSLNGVAVVVEAARQFKEIARSELADKFLASPALADGRMFLRGETNLWCLGSAPAK